MSEPRQPTPTESELVEFLQSVDVRAPEELHGRVDELIAARSRRGRPTGVRRASSRRPLFGARLAAAISLATVMIVALAVALGGGGGSTLGVGQAAQLTLRPATAPAPAPAESGQAQLAASVDGVSFPYWQDHFGWRATGARSDLLDGRAVTTVFYQGAGGRRIGYAIVAGTPPPAPRGEVVASRGGVPYRLLSVNGVHVISWLRDGRLCVVSGRGIDSATLVRLASWTNRPPPLAVY